MLLVITLYSYFRVYADAGVPDAEELSGLHCLGALAEQEIDRADSAAAPGEKREADAQPSSGTPASNAPRGPRFCSVCRVIFANMS